MSDNQKVVINSCISTDSAIPPEIFGECPEDFALRHFFQLANHLTRTEQTISEWATLEVFDGIAFQVTPLLKEIIEKNLNHFFPRFRNIVKHRGNTIQYRWLRDLLRFKVGLLQESFREKSLSHKFQFEPVDNLLELLESEIVREESYGYEEEIVLLYEIIQKSPSSTEISLLPFRKSEKAHLANLMAYKGQYQNCSGSYTMRDVEHIDWLLQGLLQNII